MSKFPPTNSLRLLIIFFTLIILIFNGISGAFAATPAAGFTLTTPVTTLNAPTGMTFAPDGRLFIIEQGGTIQTWDGTTLTLFGTVANVRSDNEFGLLGIAFDPNFATNPYLYVYYTTPPAGAPHNRISRFNIGGGTLGAEQILLDLPNLAGTLGNNGGSLAFGPDGLLYVSVGENYDEAQSPDINSPLGKILRMNTDGTPAAGNPYFGAIPGNDYIWALGLRNPFQISFQPGTGLMYINDVGDTGAGAFEEINQGTIGANYGWSPTPPNQGTIGIPGLTDPIFDYPHGGFPFYCAVTGGDFYNPAVNQFPGQYAGTYLFADYCAGTIRAYDPGTDALVAGGPLVTGVDADGLQMVSVEVAPDGSLYFVGRPFAPGPATLYRLSFPTPVVITQDPVNAAVTEVQSATFTCAATGEPAPTYQWQRNGVNIPGATSTSYTLPVTSLSDSGATFRCVASNTIPSSDTSADAVLNVNTIPAAPPAAVVSSGGSPSISVFDPALSKVGELAPGGFGLVGEALTWVITVRNNGSVTGTNIVISDTIRSEMRVDGAETARGTRTISGQTVTFNIPSLAPAESVVMRIFTTVLSSPLNGIITNRATLTSSDPAITRATDAQVHIVSQLPVTGLSQRPWWVLPLLTSLLSSLALGGVMMAWRRVKRTQ